MEGELIEGTLCGEHVVAALDSSCGASTALAVRRLWLGSNADVSHRTARMVVLLYRSARGLAVLYRGEARPALGQGRARRSMLRGAFVATDT